MQAATGRMLTEEQATHQIIKAPSKAFFKQLSWTVVLDRTAGRLGQAHREHDQV